MFFCILFFCCTFYKSQFQLGDIRIRLELGEELRGEAAPVPSPRDVLIVGRGLG